MDRTVLIKAPAPGSQSLDTGGDGSPAKAKAAAASRLDDVSAQPREPTVGDLLRGRFRLEEVISRGGMGVVFKATDLSRDEALFPVEAERSVAIKILNNSFSRHPDSARALGREYANTQRLNHPGIVRLYDFDRDEQGRYFIAMELLSGQPLDKAIRGLRNSGLGMPFAQAYELLHQIGGALAAAHNAEPPLVHSDIKPSNVFVSPAGKVKVFDFGIARSLYPDGLLAEVLDQRDVTNVPEKGQLTRWREVKSALFDAGALGAVTPAYASLEMLQGEPPDPRDDIYALALVAYELLSGQRPYGRTTTAIEARDRGLVPARIRSLSKRQWRGLQRGLALERAVRTPKVEQFLDELSGKRSVRHWLLAGGIAAIGVGLGLILIDSSIDWRMEEALISQARGGLRDDLVQAAARADTSPVAMRKRFVAALGERLTGMLVAGRDDAGEAPDLEALTVGLPETVRADVLRDVAQRVRARVPQASADDLLIVAEGLRALSPSIRRPILDSSGAVLEAAILSMAKDCFAPSRGGSDYARADRLLRSASELFPASKGVAEARESADVQRRTWESGLLARLDPLAKAGRLLFEPSRTGIPDVLTALIALDPDVYPQTVEHLARAYLAAARECAAQDPMHAQQLLGTALTFFPNAHELIAEHDILQQSRSAQSTKPRDLQRLPAPSGLDDTNSQP